MQLEQYLQQYFGYETFRPGQKEVLEQLIAGKDVIALLPTGMGKSLCYQLPGYVFDKPVLIISPLLSLMQDQVDQLKQMGEKRVVALNSFLTPVQKNYALHYLHEYRFIFTSPEMLLQPQVKARLASMELSLIVADEAHCISQWGYDFRPDYLRIGEVIQVTNRPPVLALSATATSKVLHDIDHYLEMNRPFTYVHSVDRPNIHLVKKPFALKEDKLVWILEHVEKTAGPGIIYTQSRAKTESISSLLLQRGIAAAAYHAGKDMQDRQFIQQQFLSGQLDWIVATNAFGMGIHKNNVRQIIHEAMPSTVANYMQEIGRAGRDGQDAVAFLLFCEGDEQFAKFIVSEDLPKEFHVDRYAQTVATGEEPRVMLSNGEISEVAFRVLNYWMEREAVEQVKKRLVNMQMAKFEEVMVMLQIVESKGCMRELLIHYFGQHVEQKHENCCSNCGVELSELIQERVKSISQSQMTDWKARLQQILLRNL
ncbi:MAG: ATP-dependent DNA helicase RecQ [Solibacillus sp.]